MYLALTENSLLQHALKLRLLNTAITNRLQNKLLHHHFLRARDLCVLNVSQVRFVVPVIDLVASGVKLRCQHVPVHFHFLKMIV